MWAAKDAEDLADILDADVNDETKTLQGRVIHGALMQGHFSELPDQQSFLRLVASRTERGSNIVPGLLEGLRIVSVIVEQFVAAKRTPGKPPVPVAVDDERLDLHAMPLPLLQIVLTHGRATMCLAALVDLCISRRRNPPPPPWLAKSVVRGWVEGERAWLCFNAMTYPGQDVPIDLLPETQRLTREGVLAVHNDGVTAFEQFLAKAPLSPRAPGPRRSERPSPDLRLAW